MPLAEAFAGLHALVGSVVVADVHVDQVPLASFTGTLHSATEAVKDGALVEVRICVF